MKPQRIVHDGWRRLRRAREREVREALRREIQEQLREAGALRRFVLSWRIRREAARRVKDTDSPYNLYSAAGAGPFKVERRNRGR